VPFEIRFKPATKFGQPVAYWQTVEIEFTLGETSSTNPAIAGRSPTSRLTGVGLLHCLDVAVTIPR
jgi:hypothetical protein